MISLTGLTTTAFIAWAAIGLTVLSVLYLLKLRRRRVAVPYLPLWQKVLKQSESESLFQRLRKLLSWLLQLLFWFLLLLALGNPRIRSELLGGQHTVLILDTSASMKALEGKKSRLSLAKERATSIIRKMRGRDRLMLVSMSRDITPITAFSSNKKHLLKQLKRIKSDDTPASLRSALALAQDALQGKKDKRVLVLSDGAFGPAVQDLFKKKKSTARPTPRPPKTPPVRRPASRVKDPDQPSARRTKTRARRGRSRRTRRSRRRRSRRRTRRRGRRKPVRRPPPLPRDVNKKLVQTWKKATTVRRNFPDFRLIRIGEVKENVGIIAFSARRRIDNPLQFSAYIQVINVGTQPAKGKLEILVDDLVVQVITLSVTPGKTWSRTLPRITARGERLKARIKLTEGKDFLPSDNEAYAVLPKARPTSVLLVSNDNLYLYAALLASSGIRFEKIRCNDPIPPRRVFDVFIYNNCGAKQMPTDGRYLFFNPTSGKVPFGVDTASKKRRKAPIITESNSTHPIMRFVALKDLNISKGLLIKKRKKKGENTLASTFGKPVIMSRDHKGLRAVLVGFALRESDFPLRVGFPLFVRATIDWLMRGGRPLPPTTRTTGKRWTLYLPRRLKQVRIDTPDLKTALVPVVKGTAYYSGARAGFYRVRGDKFERWVAANLSSIHESTIRPTTQVPKTNKNNVNLPDEGATITLFGLTIPLPRPLWLWLLLAVVFLLTVEWYTYNRRITV